MFLAQVWDHLELKDFYGQPSPPTPTQNDIARYLQHGPKRCIIEAFRGVGKSWITVAFVLWVLFNDPDKKILVVSGSGQLADTFSTFCKQLIYGMPLLEHLKPRPDKGQRDSNLMFDVGPSKSSRDPSVKSAGITGQITGSRADIIIADDIETPKNSYTHVMRERLSELVKEFAAILKPGEDSRIIYLGTPQIEQSLYNRLPERGYKIRIWPAEIPTSTSAYHGRLAPFVQRMIDAGATPGSPVDPKRFDRVELDEKREEYKAAGYALQFMLDTNPSDVDKHPLKLRDLLIMDVDAEMGHSRIVWSGEKGFAINDLPPGGFDGDFYVGPVWRSTEMQKWNHTVMHIDPSGSGTDETGYAIVRLLNSQLYAVDVGGYLDGFGEATLWALARKAIRHRVNDIIVETNYGGGMFDSLLKPVLSKAAEEAKLDENNPDPKARPPRVLGKDDGWNGWSSTQKEARICDTLEPLLRSHRLVIDRRVIEEDAKILSDTPRYSLAYQLTRMFRQKGALPNEDRLESMAAACAFHTERLGVDADKLLARVKQSKQDEELKAFMRNVTARGGRVLQTGSKPARQHDVRSLR